MITILLVESSDRYADQVCDALKMAMPNTYDVHRVGRVREAMHYLRQHHNVSVVLSDVDLPDARGDEALRMLRRSSKVPVIFMTDTDHAGQAMEALQHGAQDYIVKTRLDADYLVRVIRYAIERHKYQDEVQTAKAKARLLRHETKLLRQEQQRLSMLNQAKDEFISLASHQLRTPATGVKQFIGMLLEGFAGEVPEDLRPFLQKAYESNERQLAIVNDLLKVAQLDAGKVLLRRKPTDLTEMLGSIVTEQSSKFSQRRQTLDYDSSTPALMAEVDPERMRMVFDNLIDNASKYTPEGRAVTVTLHQNDDQAVVNIRDEGVGIAPQDLERIFQKFGRVANERSDLVGGSGLGLYWAKRIVDLHDGSIDVRSEVGRGSEFIVRLDRHTP